jgi:hypothetical protein
MPPIATPPVASAPLFQGGPVVPDCPTCVTPHPAGYGHGYVGPAGGVPTISNPMPLGTGPTVEPSRELPFPMQSGKEKDKNY